MFSSQKASLLQQLQNCLQSAIKALISDQVLVEGDVEGVIDWIEEMDDFESASEALYDVIMEKAKSDPNIVVKFIECVGKVNSTICNLFRSAPHLTWQQLKQKREYIVQTLDTSAIIDPCLEKSIITLRQYELLMTIKEKEKTSAFFADRFLRVLEKSEKEQGSELKEFEKVLLDRQPDLLKTLLETSKSTKYTVIIPVVQATASCHVP